MVELALLDGLASPWTPWLVGLLLLAAAHLAEQWRVRRRRRSLTQALDSSTAAHWAPATAPRGIGLAGELRPAPEPFASLQVTGQVLPRYDPLGFAWTQAMRRQDGLTVRARLARPPTNELVWQRGKLPGLALGPGGPELWSRRRLDIIASEYAVRGPNPAALVHGFHELQTRFGPFLRTVTVQADSEPHCVVELAAARLSADEVPALVAAVRSLGRGALQK